MQKYKQGLELWGLNLRSNGGGTVIGSNFLGTLIHANTVDRTYTLPDKSGTIALLSDISTGGLSLSSTLVGYALGTDGTALAETDTILQAYQKLQVQSNNKVDLTTSGQVISGSKNISNTTVSTSTTTGALVVAGGVGIGGKVYVAGNIQTAGTVTATSFSGSGSGLTGTAASLTAGAVSSITGGQVTTALGFTPLSTSGTAADSSKLGGVAAASYALTSSIPVASSTTPSMDGTAAIGSGTTWAKADHIHPSDTAKLGVSATAADSSKLGGVAAASYALASAIPVASTTNPAMNGTAAPGTAAPYARQDHVHPTDASRAAIGQTFYLGTTNIAINRASGSQALTGITSIDGSAATLTTPRAINGVNFNGSAAITVPLNSTDDVATATSVYPVWTTTAGNVAAKISTTKFSFVPSTGAVSATSFNGITGLASTAPAVDGTATIGTSTLAAHGDHIHPTDTTRAAVGQTFYLGTTSLAINRASASQALTGISSIDGSAATLTTSRAINGVAFNGSADVTVPVHSTNDNATSTTCYPLWTTAAGDTAAAISASTFTWIPSTGTLGITTLQATGNVTAYYSSDRRLKTNIKPIENPIEKLQAIRGVSFDWTDSYIKQQGGEDGYFIRKHDVGVIAQELQQVMPEVVGERPDGFLGVKYDKIVVLLIEAVKAQQEEINELKKMLENK